MADDGTVSLTEYARLRGVARRAIQQQVESGVIKVIDGRIDPRQADGSWGIARRGSRGIVNLNDDAGVRSAKAKVAMALAKLRLLRHRHETLRERYVDRAEAIRVGEEEATFVLAALRAAPAAYVDTLAAELAISRKRAARIL